MGLPEAGTMKTVIECVVQRELEPCIELQIAIGS